MEYSEVICADCKSLLPNESDKCKKCGSNKKIFNLIFSEQMHVNYTDRIIAFIDILGFKQIIDDSEKDRTKIGAIYEQLLFLKEMENTQNWNLELIEIKEDAQRKDIWRFDISKNVVCSCFSDSIVVSVECFQENINEAFSTLVANLSKIGAKLLIEGILIRGAISMGKLFHTKDGIIMGKALIDSYHLEKKAKYPRIILSDALISKLNYPICSKRERYPYHQYLNRFEDGCVGFHQMIYYQVLQSWIKMDEKQLKEDLEKIRYTIINGLDSTFEEPEIFEKYFWLKKQYDELIILDDDIKIDIKKLNQNIAGQNIHYKYTDDFYKKRKKDNE